MTVVGVILRSFDVALELVIRRRYSRRSNVPVFSDGGTRLEMCAAFYNGPLHRMFAAVIAVR